MIHRSLHAGDRPTSVHPKGVRELWYVIDGYGELGPSSPASANETVPLWPGFCVSVEAGTYQVQATGAGALQIFVLAMPEPFRGAEPRPRASRQGPDHEG
jgi:mannose-6-phosphate isomerase-like protein (cupin superfamily)